MPRYRIGHVVLETERTWSSLRHDESTTGERMVLVEHSRLPLESVAFSPVVALMRRDAPERRYLGIFCGPTGYLLELDGVGAFLVAGERIDYALEPGVDDATLEQALVDQILPRALHLRGRPSLHASAALLPSVGVIALTGDSGAGKSTLAARLATRGRVVSDDSLALEVAEHAILALPGYGSLRLWQDAARAVGDDPSRLERATARGAKLRAPRALADGPSPLVLVVVLERQEGGQASLEPLSKRAAFEALRRQVHRLAPDDPAALTAEFALLTSVAERVPVVRLRFAPGLDALDALVELIAAATPR